MSDEIVYAEDLNYFKTSAAAADSWIEKAKKLIHDMGGEVITQAFGAEFTTGKAAFMMMFSHQGNHFHIVWPVLKSRKEESLAAKRQAATMLYHDVKAKCLASKVLGIRTAFLPWYVVDGQPLYQKTDQKLIESIPSIALIGYEDE